MEQSAGSIGKSVVIKGDLRAKEDLTIEGRVEGTVELNDNVLTIGPNGRIEAQLLAKAVIVMGKVDGNITATETITLRETAAVDGALVAPRIGITEGASFRGQIDMQGSQTLKESAAGTAKTAKGIQATPTPVAAARR